MYAVKVKGMERESKVKTAYAYARFSSDNQREESITAQLRAIHEYCDTNGIRILQEFKDEAKSATTDKRPQFQELFAKLKERPADYLIVHKLDRFARNRYDAAFYRKVLKDNSMKLVSVLERLDDSPESIIMEGLLESMNEYYSANLSRETKKGLKENVLMGRRNGGKAPIGYSVINQHLTPNADAEKVTQVFEMYAEGMSYREMEEYSGWPHSNIRNMLKNEVYLGHIISGENRYENAHQPLVSQDTWNACRRRMSTANSNASNRAKYDYMLARMLVCEKCGKPMTGLRSGKYFFYSCRTHGCKYWHKDELEDRVCEALSNKLRPTDDIKARFYDSVQSRVNSRVDMEKANRANSALDKRIKKMLESVQFAEDEDIPAIFDQIRELKKQKVKVPEQRTVSRAACDAFIESFFDFSDKTYEEKKRIIRKVLCKIVVGEELYLTTELNGEVYGFVLK